jgi:hypothetical protein
MLQDGQLEAARETFQQVRDLIESRKTGVCEVARVEAGLSEAHRLLGDTARAVELAESALARSAELRSRIGGIYASLALARALRAHGAPSERAAAALDRADDLIEQTGAVNFRPLVLVERAELAEGAERRSFLEQALQLFRANGATGHAARAETALLGGG